MIDEFPGRPGRARDRWRTRRRRCARDLETDSRQNGTLLNQLVFAYQYDEPIPDPATMRGLYDQLSVAVLRDAARTYLDPDRYVKVVLVPDAK